VSLESPVPVAGGVDDAQVHSEHSQRTQKRGQYKASHAGRSSKKRANRNPDKCLHGHVGFMAHRIKHDGVRDAYRWTWYCMECDRVSHLRRYWKNKERSS
jgi:hypothetical protein